MTLAELVAAAHVGRDITWEDGTTTHHRSVLFTIPNGETLCCFIASKAPNSRGSRRGRHDRVGFTYRGKEISRARAEELLSGTM